MSSRQAKIQEETHFRTMRILQENPDMTQREFAAKLGISVGGLNYGLNALIDKGLVKMECFRQSKNKFGYVYLLTPKGISEKITLTTKFLEQKQAEYEALKAEIESRKRSLISQRLPNVLWQPLDEVIKRARPDVGVWRANKPCVSAKKLRTIN